MINMLKIVKKNLNYAFTAIFKLIKKTTSFMLKDAGIELKNALCVITPFDCRVRFYLNF
jgi:hypothetical protein